MNVIRATTFNAAEYDKRYRHTVHPYDFIFDKLQKREDFVLLQEANRINGIPAELDAQRESTVVKYEVVKGPRGLSIMYNSMRFAPYDSSQTDRMCGTVGTRQMMSQNFRHIRSGRVYHVVNVHAGHNHTKEEKKQACDDVIRFQDSTVAKEAEVTITGGDFNEMTTYVGRYCLGEGVLYRRTHSMGHNDKIGVKFRRGHRKKWARVGDNFGSDHRAVEIRFQM